MVWVGGAEIAKPNNAAPTAP